AGSRHVPPLGSAMADAAGAGGSPRSVADRGESIAGEIAAHAARASQPSSSPEAPTMGRGSSALREYEATLYMPSGKMIAHSAASYPSGTLCTMCRHTPAAISAGNSQVPNAQNSTEEPEIRCRVASAAGALAIATIRAPASTVIAV